MTIVMPARDLEPGDVLLRLGEVGFAQARDETAPPVLVAEVRPPEPSTPGEPLDPTVVEVVTSAGTFHVYEYARTVATRSNRVTNKTILLISRRASLFTSLVPLGVPIVRRNPVDNGMHAPAVRSNEWTTAPLIVIDGYLAPGTLSRLYGRPGINVRPPTVMVSDDLDDAGVYDRQHLINARMLLFLPHDARVMRGLFDAAVNPDTNHAPYLGVLTVT